MNIVNRLSFNWKVAILRVIINAFILAFVVIVFPNIRAPNYQFGTFIILGLIFGLLNAFLKPFLQIITLPLLFVSYGVVVIALNTLLLLLVEWVSTWIFGEQLLAIDSLLAALFAGTVAGLLASVLEYILGVTPPIIDDQAAAEGGRA